MSPTTRITDRGDELEVETEFPVFLSLYTNGDDRVRSDSFTFMGHRFRLQVLTGTGEKNEPFLVQFVKHAAETECCVELEFGIKKKDGQVENVAHVSNLTFLRHEHGRRFEFPSFSRDILQRRMSELLPSGVLTLVFTLRKGDLTTCTTTTGRYVSCSLNAGTHPGLLPRVEFQQEKAATSPTTRILKDRLVEVELEIPTFLSLTTKENRFVWSDAFPFMGHLLRFAVSTGTGEMNETFSVAIMRYTRETECSGVLTFCIKKEDGQVENVAHISNLTFLRHEWGRWFKFPSFLSDVLQRRRSELLPSGVLTLVFTLCKGDLANDITATGLRKLSDDLGALMQSGEESDCTVSVQGEKFNLHRNILGARSPVFRCMLNHEMVEKTTGIVSIDDCEPAPFRAFVRYVYSARVDELSTDTVFGLYALADKYQTDELKSACLGFIQETLSVETFCDVLALALTYHLKDLLNQATDFFSLNMTDVIQTVKWMNFLKDHPIQANELTLRALLKNKMVQEKEVSNKRKRDDDQKEPNKQFSK